MKIHTCFKSYLWVALLPWLTITLSMENVNGIQTEIKSIDNITQIIPQSDEYHTENTTSFEYLQGLPGDHYVMLEHAGLKRYVLVHIPASYNKGENAVPLVLMFHGGSGTSHQAARSYHWKEKSDAEGFIVAFPDGTGNIQTWNSGHCCGSSRRNDIDDIGFVRLLITEFQAKLNINNKMIYATGMSNGGMMSHLLASEMSDVFAAVAPVAGTIGGRAAIGEPIEYIDVPTNPIPIIMFHGFEDTNVKYKGGRSTGGFRTTRVDISQSMCVKFWVKANKTERKPEIKKSESGNIITAIFSDPVNNADVVHVTIKNQGHAWPGGKWNGIGDKPTKEISATDQIWDFFKAHQKP